jgi:hypothetical protein
MYTVPGCSRLLEVSRVLKPQTLEPKFLVSPEYDDLRFARFERIVVDWSAKTDALGCDSDKRWKCKHQGTTLL